MRSCWVSWSERNEEYWLDAFCLVLEEVSVNLEVAGDRLEGVKERVESEEMKSAAADSTFKSVFIKKRSGMVMI